MYWFGLLVMVLILTNVYSQTDICYVCSCKTDIVECQGRMLKDLAMNEIKWPSSSELEILLDYNFIENFTQISESKAIKLSLSNNRLTTIAPQAFIKLPNLRTLDLSCNQLTTESLNPIIFEGLYDASYLLPLKSLRVLNLSSNKLRSLNQNVFIHLPNLESLDLSYNPIREIDSNLMIALASAPYLAMLDLSYSGIAKLPDYFLHMNLNLKFLNLNGNNFKEAPLNFIEDNHDLVTIKLEENPLLKNEDK